MNEQKKSSCSVILQQIMELERLQLPEGVDDSGGSRVRHDATWKEHRMVENNAEHSDGTLVDKSEDAVSSPFPQLESFSNGGNQLNGDGFWQYRSPVHNNEVATKRRIER